MLRATRTAARRWPDSAQTALKLSRQYFAAPAPGRYGPIEDTEVRTDFLARQLAFRGHVREAQRLAGAIDKRITFELLYVPGAPTDLLAARVAQLARIASYADLAPAWWGSRGDTASLSAFLADGRRRAALRRNPVARLRAEYDTAAALAHLALARRDTADALRRLVALPDTLCPGCYPDRLTRARLLAAGGRRSEALRDLDEPLSGMESPLEVIMAYERARVAEQLGLRAVAAQAYRLVADAWQFSDPEVQPYVTEAKRGLARLSARRP